MGKYQIIEVAWFVCLSNNSQRNSILDKPKKELVED